MYEICSKLTETPECDSGGFIINFEQITLIVLLLSLLTLNK